MSERLPKPWHIDPDVREDMEWNNHINAANGNTVCFMAWSGDRADNEAHEKAAMLIASAPDLLEALEAALAVMADPIVGTIYHDEPRWYAAKDKAIALARAAIARARAPQPTGEG